MLLLAERGRWFAVGCNGPSVAQVDVHPTKPMHRFSHKKNEKTSKLWLKVLYKNALAENDLHRDLISIESDLESDLAKFENALVRKCGSSVKEILSNRVDLLINYNTTDGQGWTMLHHAAEQGNVDAVRMLLAMAKQDRTDACLRLDVNKRDERGRTALFLTVTGRKSKLITASQAEDTKNSPSSTRVGDPRLSVIEELLAAGANVNLFDNQNKNVLHCAVDRDNADAVRMLLAIQTDRDSYSLFANALDERGTTALMLAVELGHEEVVRALIENEVRSGVQVRECDRMEPVTDKACYHWSEKEPITNKARYQWSDKESITGMACYQWSDQEPVTDKACNQFSDKEPVLHINARDTAGKTALMYAAYEGYAKIFKLLLECGADVFACDDTGNNTLHQVVMTNKDGLSQDRLMIIETLIDCGLNVNSQNYVGDEVLQRLVQHNRPKDGMDSLQTFEDLKYLLYQKENAALNGTNASGKTIVHTILSTLKSKLTCEYLQKFLNSYDFDLQARDIDMKTALDYITCVECRQRVIETIPALNAHSDNRANASQDRSNKSQLFEFLLNERGAFETTLEVFRADILEQWYRRIVAPTGKDTFHHFFDCSRDDKMRSYSKLLIHVTHALDADLIARDERGRTYLHLVALLINTDDSIRGTLDEIYWDIAGNEQDIKKKINIADECGRTVLHYVADPCICIFHLK